MLKQKLTLKGKQTGDAHWPDNVDNVQILSICFSLIVLLKPFFLFFFLQDFSYLKFELLGSLFTNGLYFSHTYQRKANV